MKTSKIISGALAAVMVASTAAIGGVAASAATLKKPTGVTIVSTKAGLRISWNKVKGAKKYQVIRNNKVTKTVKRIKSYDHKTKAGKTYTYKIVAVNGKKKSVASAAVSYTRLKQPVISSVAAKSTGLKVTWKAVTGAKTYNVYRKTTGDFKQIASKVSGKTYTDTTAKSGTKYTYKVKAVKGKSISVASRGKSGLFLAATKSITAKATKTDITLTWDKVTGAESYNVYDRAGKLVGTATETTLKVTPDVKNISILKYSVQAVKGDVKSAKASTEVGFVPENSYFTDEEGNIHAKVTLAVGEAFKDGSYAKKGHADAATVSQVNGNDVATIDADYVITAKAAGTAQFKVEYTTATADLINKLITDEGYSFNNKFTTGVAFVDVTVA